MWERAILRIAYVLVGVLTLTGLSMSSSQAAAPEFPQLTGRVVDEAGVLSDDAKRQLDAILAGDEQRFGGRQIVVVTLKSLQGHPIEEYGYQLGRHWGIGQKGKDNGALVIVAPKEHAARIEVGYGLEGALTDARSRIIIERTMLPAFRRGDYDGGILAGTKAVLGTLGNTSYSTPRYDEDRDEEAPGWSTALFIILLIFFFAGRSFFWPLLFMGGFGGRRGGWGGGGGFGGGGFGGGGFSGGGGSFGGGGASGRW